LARPSRNWSCSIRGSICAFRMVRRMGTIEKGFEVIHAQARDPGMGSLVNGNPTYADK
jgi:hypothetical protein